MHGAFSPGGISSRASRLLLIHFVRWNPPLANNCTSFFASLEVWGTVATDFKQSSTWKLRLTVSTVCAPKSFAVFVRAKLAQQGEDEAPNKCTTIWWLSAFLDNTLSCYQRKGNAWQSSSATYTWWNICFTSTIKATSSCQNQSSTPVRLFVGLGPWSNCSFSEVSPNRAAQSKTTRTLLGLCLWMTGCCCKYHRGLPLGILSFLVWPCAM